MNFKEGQSNDVENLKTEVYCLHLVCNYWPWSVLQYLPGNLLVRDYAGSVLAAWHKPRHIQEQGNVNWGIASLRLACRQLCGDILLISNWCGNTHLIVGVDTPEYVALGCIRNLTEQAMDSKQVGKIPPWSWFQFLPPGSCLRLLPGLCKVYWS